MIITERDIYFLFLSSYKDHTVINNILKHRSLFKRGMLLTYNFNNQMIWIARMQNDHE